MIKIVKLSLILILISSNLANAGFLDLLRIKKNPFQLETQFIRHLVLVQNPLMPFKYLGDEKNIVLGRIMASGESMAGGGYETVSASVSLTKPVIVVDAGLLRGKVVPFVLEIDDELCRKLGYSQVGLSGGNNLTSFDQVVATIYENQILVGPANKLSLKTGKKIESILGQLYCE